MVSLCLARFDLHQRNGKYATGKSNKFLYKERRRLAVSLFLSLQYPFENNISFSEAIGHDKKEKPLESIPISEWDNIAVRYIEGKAKTDRCRSHRSGGKGVQNRSVQFVT